MRNYALLIRKDFISAVTAYSNLIVILVIWIAMLAFSPGAGPMMFIMLVYLMVIALFQVEENELVCNVAGILPIRRAQAVTARYLYTYAVMLGGFVSGAVVSLISALIRGSQGSWLDSLILSMAMALLMASISIPLVYRFGMVKMRMLIMIIYVVMIAAASALMPLVTTWLPASSLGMALLALAGAVVLSLISLSISQRVAQR